MTTVRELVEELRLLASMLPDDMNTPVKIGICDGKNLQVIDQVDISEWVFQRLGSPDRDSFILIRAHNHPGEDSAEQMRGVTADVDEEVRKLTEE